jgi:hypothetical protein
MKGGRADRRSGLPAPPFTPVGGGARNIRAPSSNRGGSAMNASLRITACASLVVAGVLAFPQPVAADANVTVSAGVACQPASGALAAKVNYNLQYLTNVGTTDLTVVCFVPKTDYGYYTYNFTSLTVAVWLPNAGQTVTCLAQTGHFRDAGNYIRTSAAKAHTSAEPGDYHSLVWTVELLRNYTTDILVLNCKLPPGAKMGTIERVDAEPNPFPVT